jgi:hypothetical protein
MRDGIAIVCVRQNASAFSLLIGIEIEISLVLERGNVIDDYVSVDESGSERGGEAHHGHDLDSCLGCDHAAGGHDHVHEILSGDDLAHVYYPYPIPGQQIDCGCGCDGLAASFAHHERVRGNREVQDVRLCHDRAV